jgi:acyl phosphate:glycerol-3-phosphate acyltransferase
VHPSVGLALAYLLGSIPAAHIAGKAKGVDLRLHGSGNLGATNAWRVLGWKIGLAVYLFDTAKGFIPAFFFPRWLHANAMEATNAELWAIAYGVAAILGHVQPLFLRGKGGGKGVATAGGVFLGLAPVALLASLAVFAAVLLTTGYVSLGSLVAAVMLPVVLVFTRGVQSPLFVVSLLLAAFVFYTHRANIARLRRGEESRFGRRGATPADGGRTG